MYITSWIPITLDMFVPIFYFPSYTLSHLIDDFKWHWNLQSFAENWKFAHFELNQLNLFSNELRELVNIFIATKLKKKKNIGEFLFYAYSHVIAWVLGCIVRFQLAKSSVININLNYFIFLFIRGAEHQICNNDWLTI